MLELSALITDTSTRLTDGLSEIFNYSGIFLFFFFFYRLSQLCHPSITTRPAGDVRKKSPQSIQITVINFALMTEEMSANGQSSPGRHVWEPSLSAHFSVVKACWDLSLGLGIFCPFVLELEALTLSRGCNFWGLRPCAGSWSCPPSWNVWF